jgi:hypothetical protein
VHLAYVEENGVDGIQGRTWARGYMHGTRLAPEGWSRIFGDEREALLLMIPIAAGEVDPEWPKEPLTPERNDELLQNMLAGAARAYRYFKEDRIASAMAAARPEPYERARWSLKSLREDAETSPEAWRHITRHHGTARIFSRSQ